MAAPVRSQQQDAETAALRAEQARLEAAVAERHAALAEAEAKLGSNQPAFILKRLQGQRDAARAALQSVQDELAAVKAKLGAQ